MNTTKKNILIFLVFVFILAVPIIMMFESYTPILGVWIMSKLAIINIYWASIIGFVVTKLPPWALVLLTRPIAMVKRHGTKVIAINIGSKLVMKKVGPHAKVVIEKTIREVAQKKDNLQTRLVSLVIWWRVFKYKPTKENMSFISKLFKKTFIKIIAMIISFILVIIAIIFLGETQIIRVIKNIIEYILEIDIVQKQVLKKAGNTWFERLSDRLYNIRFIGGVLAIILIIFLKLVSWIPIIGRYAEVNPTTDCENNSCIINREYFQTKYERNIKLERSIVYVPS